MKPVMKTSIACMVAVGALTLTASACWAGCGESTAPAPASFHMDSSDDASLVPAAWRDSSDSLLRKVDYGNEDSRNSIVGMWRVQFLVGGNQIDIALSQWHSDGTEFMNSGTLNPAGQNYCLGVWQKTSPLSYHLNHLAFGYVPTLTTNGQPAIHIDPSVTVNIKEDVVLDRQGMGFTGTFSIDAYDYKTNALIPSQHVAGRVVGQRITAM